MRDIMCDIIENNEEIKRQNNQSRMRDKMRDIIKNNEEIRRQNDQKKRIYVKIE